jgi:hypothetical protein
VKLDLPFTALERLKSAMGARSSPWSPGTASLHPREEIRVELQSGIEISLEDIDRGPGGLLSYKGEQIILYIKDTRASRFTLEHEPEKTRRFHIAECKTMADMREKGRFERFVATNRMDGKFLVDWFEKDTGDRGETEAALKVCKYCLIEVNWRGYDRPRDRLQLENGQRQDKDAIWKDFRDQRFSSGILDLLSTSLPTRRDITAGQNVYVANWASISERMRRAKNWTCEACGVNLRTAPHLLHTHHKSGVVTDNRDANLEVLCALCHADQPNHEHLRIPPRDRNRIIELRLRQNVSR